MRKKHFCLDCKKEIYKYKNTKRCKSCENKRRYENNVLQGGRYRDGRTLKKYYGKDCGIELSDYRHKRCKKCFGLSERGKNYPKCIDCNRILKGYKQQRCHSCELKKRWQNPIYALKVLRHQRKRMKIRPNKPEKLLNLLLKSLLPNQYKYVGNGKIFIGRFNPDFINKKRKLIIELYGDYWHNKKTWKKRDKNRIKTYRDYGYKTLIIWQHELTKLDKVTNKIINFNGENDDKF